MSWLDRAQGALYVLSQRLVGADLAREQCVAALAPRAGQRILDIGCGPAYYLGALPPCEYHGFDTDRAQIASARERFGDKGTFYDQPYTEAHQQKLGLFDGVMLLGLLHHLDDREARSLLQLVTRSLRPGARVITLDTAYFEGQSRLARALAMRDRGKFVRPIDDFKRFGEEAFESVQDRIVGDTLRMPASHYMMVLERPRAAGPS
jgi:SAM-dependent methyltransferase